MNKPRDFWVGATAVGVVFLAGCDSKVPGGDVAAKPSGQAAPAKQADAPPAPKTDLDRSKIPANLQTDAYAYSGVSRSEPMDYSITTKPDKGTFTGERSARLTQVDSGSATFAVETTGTLNDALGNEVDAVKPDGYYAVSSDKQTLNQPELQLPTGFTSGKPWVEDSSSSGDKQTIHQHLNYKCLGERTVEIGKTSYPAMYIEGHGTLEMTGKTYSITTQQWWVKDIGNVKMQMVQTTKGQPPVTFNMICKPLDSKAKS